MIAKILDAKSNPSMLNTQLSPDIYSGSILGHHINDYRSDNIYDGHKGFSIINEEDLD